MITLVNTLSRILEKYVALKLNNHLQLNDLLYQHQYGSQQERSTEHNLIHVINFISSALNKGNYCIGIFLDLKKAFDVCNHAILINKLKKFGIEGTALNWFSSYLKDRRQKVDINGNLSSETLINISVLQGTILGQLLFLCYINDIYTVTKLVTFLFADDTLCLAEHSNLNDLINFINTELHKLANWFLSNKMVVNTSKTKYIIFRTRGKPINIDTPPVLFNSNEIGTVENPNEIFPLDRVFLGNKNPENRTYKLLAVYFDEYLNFDKHIAFTCAKMSRSVYCIKRVSNILSSKSLRSLYFALVHPHLLYCNTILNCSSMANIKKICIIKKKLYVPFQNLKKMPILMNFSKSLEFYCLINCLNYVL